MSIFPEFNGTSRSASYRLHDELTDSVVQDSRIVDSKCLETHELIRVLELEEKKIIKLLRSCILQWYIG